MRISLVISVFLLTLISASNIRERGMWLIDSSSQLSIHGQTNVNNFTCLISCYNNTDTLNYDYSGQSNELIFDKNRMIIPIYNFNCGNNLITRDFRQTLKADQFPYLKVTFLSLKKMPASNEATAKIEVSLANTVKQAKVAFLLRKNADLLQLTGKHDFYFSDFGLEAPQRMMGLVKVQEKLEVEFNLLLRPLLKSPADGE